MTSWYPLQLVVSQARRFIGLPLLYESGISLDIKPSAFDLSPPCMVLTVDGVVTLRSKKTVLYDLEIGNGPHVVLLGLFVRVGHRPVLPKPPLARVVSSSCVTTSKTTPASDTIIICATRSPAVIVWLVSPWFINIAMHSPR